MNRSVFTSTHLDTNQIIHSHHTVPFCSLKIKFWEIFPYVYIGISSFFLNNCVNILLYESITIDLLGPKWQIIKVTEYASVLTRTGCFKLYL